VTGHLWSLSAEEQFYLVYPAAIKFAGKARIPSRHSWQSVPLLVALVVSQTNHDLGVRVLGVFSDSIAWWGVLGGAMHWLRRQQLFSTALFARAGCLIMVIIPLIDHRNRSKNSFLGD
jgi:peptidoglycan/LPS O-acetylase OafA/YrhL